MKTLTIRGIDEKTSKKLKEYAESQNTSINQTALRILHRAFGIEKNVPFMEHHDLDELSGTWSSTDLAEFEKNIKHFDKIDMDMWK